MNNNISQIEGNKMLSLAKKLFPINRSILGPGIRESLEVFKTLNPEFQTIIFKTGEQVFDWQIPYEWDINDAYLEHESGIRFAEFKKNNLHVVSYSKPVKETINKEKLLKKIYTLPKQRNAIPYMTSYYKNDWGFCLDKETLEKMPEGNYNVVIDSKLSVGELHLIEAIIKGVQKRKEIFFSSYLCHPSMANNELSGPVLLNQILSYIKKKYPKPKHSYRFVLLPETIGSIAYISKRLDELKTNLVCGFNLTCVGDERAYSYIQSRNGNNLADKALKASLIGKDNFKTFSFLDRGSDERQYCAPGIDLPLATFCRSRFGDYPEYHTSLDDFNVVTANGLQGSFEIMKNIIDAFELGLYPKVKFLCEPNLGKRGLYPLTSELNGVHPAELRTNILAYCDGQTSLFEISQILNINLYYVIQEIKILKTNKIIEINS